MGAEGGSTPHRKAPCCATIGHWPPAKRHFCAQRAARLSSSRPAYARTSCDADVEPLSAIGKTLHHLAARRATTPPTPSSPHDTSIAFSAPGATAMGRPFSPRSRRGARASLRRYFSGQEAIGEKKRLWPPSPFFVDATFLIIFHLKRRSVLQGFCRRTPTTSSLTPRHFLLSRRPRREYHQLDARVDFALLICLFLDGLDI